MGLLNSRAGGNIRGLDLDDLILVPGRVPAGKLSVVGKNHLRNSRKACRGFGLEIPVERLMCAHDL